VGAGGVGREGSGLSSASDAPPPMICQGSEVNQAREIEASRLTFASWESCLVRSLSACREGRGKDGR
jgi:hypothetical protein